MQLTAFSERMLVITTFLLSAQLGYKKEERMKEKNKTGLQILCRDSCIDRSKIGKLFFSDRVAVLK